MNIRESFRKIGQAFLYSRLGKFIMPPEEVGGLEISADSLKFLLLRPHGDSVIWEHYASRPLAAGIIVDGQVKNVDGLASQIKQLFESVVTDKKLTREVIVVIPESGWHIDTLNIPAALQDSIVKDVIMNNPAVAFPFPLPDIYISWQKVAAEGLEKRIVIAYAKRDVVDNYQRAVELAGLHPIALQASTLGFEFFIQFSKDVSAIYLLENLSCTVAAYLDGKLFYKRTVMFQDVIPAGTKFGFQAVADVIEKDFARVKDFVLSEIGEERVCSLLLLSAFPGTDQIADILKKKDLPIQTVSVRKMDLPKTMTNASLWSNVLGAAFRGLMPRRIDNFLSLLPFSTREQYLSRKKTVFFSRTTKIVFTTLIFYIMAFVFMGIFLSSTQKKTQQELLRQQAVALPQELLALEGERNAFNAGVDNLLKIQQKLVSMSPALKMMERIPIPGVSIASFQMALQGERMSVTITGTADTRENLIAFKKHLADDLALQEIKSPIQSLETRQNINFTMTFFYAF